MSLLPGPIPTLILSFTLLHYFSAKIPLNIRTEGLYLQMFNMVFFPTCLTLALKTKFSVLE